MKSINYETPPYEIFSNILLFSILSFPNVPISTLFPNSFPVGEIIGQTNELFVTFHDESKVTSPLGYETMKSYTWLPAFRKDLLSTSSG